MNGFIPIASVPIAATHEVVEYVPVSRIETGSGNTARAPELAVLGLDLLWDNGDFIGWDDDTNIGWEA